MSRVPRVLIGAPDFVREVVTGMVMYFVPVVSPFIQHVAVELLALARYCFPLLLLIVLHFILVVPPVNDTSIFLVLLKRRV